MTRFTHAGVAAHRQIACLFGSNPSLPHNPSAAPNTEILWDRYGVPHIYAADRESMFYAHGWAQMRNHADLLLRLYGESRGRAAEYWGGDANLELDRWVQLNGVPERARSWYDAQDPQFRRYLDEFARGINEFAAKNPERDRRRNIASCCPCRASTSYSIRCAPCTTATWDRARG